MSRRNRPNPSRDVPGRSTISVFNRHVKIAKPRTCIWILILQYYRYKQNNKYMMSSRKLAPTFRRLVVILLMGAACVATKSQDSPVAPQQDDENENLSHEISGSVQQAGTLNGTGADGRYALAFKYGNFCGSGNTQWDKRGGTCKYYTVNGKRRKGCPIDTLDFYCLYHDLCHKGNFDFSSANCRCQQDLYNRASSVVSSCDTSGDYDYEYDYDEKKRSQARAVSMCDMADNVKAYAWAVKSIVC
jgi:hypothetical protein